MKFASCMTRSYCSKWSLDELIVVSLKKGASRRFNFVTVSFPLLNVQNFQGKNSQLANMQEQLNLHAWSGHPRCKGKLPLVATQRKILKVYGEEKLQRQRRPYFFSGRGGRGGLGEGVWEHAPPETFQLRVSEIPFSAFLEGRFQ